jgi:hypothetical protein
VELIEEDRQVLRRDAAPVVGNADIHLIARPARPQRDVAAIGSLL